jgi:hypothetical protein
MSEQYGRMMTQTDELPEEAAMPPVIFSTPFVRAGAERCWAELARRYAAGEREFTIPQLEPDGMAWILNVYFPE